MAGNETENVCQQSSRVLGETKSRKILRPLIIKLLDDGHLTNQGLVWENKQEMIWRLPWKNKKRSYYNDPDAIVLKEIARVKWPDEAKLSVWKELLRNALRSLKDVKLLEEDKNKSYKVYQFLVEETKGKKGLKKEDQEPMFDPAIHKGPIAKAFSGEDGLFSDIEHGNKFECITNEFRSRSPLQQSQSSDDSGLCSSFAYTPQSDSQDGFSSSQESCIHYTGSYKRADSDSDASFVQYQPTVNNAGLPFDNIPNITNLLSVDETRDWNQEPLHNGTLTDSKVHEEQISALKNSNIADLFFTQCSPQGSGPIPSDTSIQLLQDTSVYGLNDDRQPNILDANSVKFEAALHVAANVSSTELGATLVQTREYERPFALLEVKYHSLTVLTHSIKHPCFGLSSRDFCCEGEGENICLPNPNDFPGLNEKQKHLINSFLTKQFKRGITFTFEGDDLVAKRQCKGGIVSQIIPDQPKGERLLRKKETKIFTYQEFMNRLQKYKDPNNSDSPPPLDSITILIGVSQNTHSVVPGRPHFITAVLHHVKAERHLKDANDDLFPNEAPDGSRSDSYDRMMASLETVHISK